MRDTPELDDPTVTPVDTETGVSTPRYIPERLALGYNQPNPFNPTTTIRYSVKERALVTLRIYNVAGQLVRTLVNDIKEPGAIHGTAWDGRNEAGRSVSSGVYFYKLVTKDFTQTKKMMLLK